MKNIDAINFAKHFTKRAKAEAIHFGDTDIKIIKCNKLEVSEENLNSQNSIDFIEKAFAGDTINIRGKNEKLDFTYVEDLAEGCILAATKKSGLNNTFNLTYGKAETLYKFIKILSKNFTSLKYRIKKRDSFRPKRGTLSINKAKKLLGYRPRYSLEKGIKKYIDFANYLKKSHE